MIEIWGRDYNTVRPQSSLGWYLTQEEFAARQNRMRRNPDVLTYAGTKNGEQVIKVQPTVAEGDCS